MYYLISAVFVIILLKIYLKYSKSVCKSNVRLDHKTVVITGADKGIGYETAKDVAGRGGRVIMACRDVENAHKKAALIRQETGSENIVVMKIDLSSLQSVKDFAKTFLEKESRLDVLINNAGMPSDVGLTTDGYEKVFQVNYLSHFLLTHLFRDLLKTCAPSRVINVSSLSYLTTFHIKPSNLNINSYSHSKALQILHALELNRQLTGVTAVSLHPGLIWNPNFFHKLSGISSMWPYLIYPFMKSSKEGAQTTIHAAVDTGVVGGGFYMECALTKTKALCSDQALSKKIYEASERYCGLVCACV